MLSPIAGFLLIFVMVSFAIAGTPNPTSASVRVASFNILAPLWADPSLYPAACNGAPLTDRNARVTRSANYLKTTVTADGALDAIALQETQTDTNAIMSQALNGFSYFAAYHSDSYWASYYTPSIQSTLPLPPAVHHGTAIAVNNQKYDSCTFVDKQLDIDGNHAAIAICRHSALNAWVRFVSVHLDSDHGGNRGKEADGLKAYLDAEISHTYATTVILGDMNADTDSGVLKSRFVNAGYRDLLRDVGLNGPTHPWSSSYNRNTQWGNIDHVLANGNVVASSGKIYELELYQQYPDANGATGVANENSRICLNLQHDGSDHFPVASVFTLNN
jgi:endonuclease/exonuclease/phosphatase family metal-dependent hydrolase